MNLQLRDFRDEDRPAILAIRNRNFLDLPMTIESLTYYDSTWDSARYERVRLVAELDGRIVGWGQVAHTPRRFDPAKYALRLEVDPDFQRRGIGNAIHEELIERLRQRRAHLVRARSQESRAAGVRFLARHGYVEAQRSWMSILDVDQVDLTSFQPAAERAANQGIVLTTLADERGRDPRSMHDIYDLYVQCSLDEPGLDVATPVPYDEFLAREIGGPEAIPEATFLARADDRFVGFSALQRAPATPDLLETGFTGVHSDYRNRGIAMALKLRAITYARDGGYRRIRTNNHSLNAPMLRINQTLGFRREPAWITFEQRLDNAPEARDALARAQVDALLLRYPGRFDPEQLEAISRVVGPVVDLVTTLRRYRLTNADEPDPIFRAARGEG